MLLESLVNPDRSLEVTLDAQGQGSVSLKIHNGPKDDYVAISVSRLQLLGLLGADQDAVELSALQARIGDAVSEALKGVHVRKPSWDDLRQIRDILNPPKPIPTERGTVLRVKNSSYPPDRDTTILFRAGDHWISLSGERWEDENLREQYISWELVTQHTASDGSEL